MPKSIRIRNGSLLWLMLSVLLLLIAYIPLGFYAPIAGFQFGWQLLTLQSNYFYKIWGAWLIIAVILGNIQIFLCFFSLTDKNPYLQNDVLKTAATISQLSWVYPGFLFYGWYFWVIGTAILFTITPNSIFTPSNSVPYSRSWSESSFLSKLRNISNKDETI